MSVESRPTLPLALPEHTGDSVPPRPPLALPEHASESASDRKGSIGEKRTGKNSGGRGSKVLTVAGIGIVALAVIIVVVLALVHRHNAKKTRDARVNEVAKGPKLSVATVQMSRPVREISLPGEVRGFNQATLYAKISGYVSEIRVDRGDRVKKGDIIAVIESPESRDDVLSAVANREYTKRAADRYNVLAPQLATELDRDNAVNAAKRADADLHRAQTLLDYTLVRAPFDGVVTNRYVDLGALVPAATSATQQAQPVVDVAEVDRVRVFLYVGQDAAGFVRTGDEAAIYQDERPSQRVPAQMTRVSGALDPRTRTMQCEIDIDNRSWNLIPGTFVHVRLAVAIPPMPVIPNDALVTRDGTPHVAVVDGGKVHYLPIEIGNDDGKTTRVESGLKGGETIGLNVPVQIDEGDVVQPVTAKQGASGSSGQDPSAQGSPTSTPTTTARPPVPGPVGPLEKNPEPNVTPDNGIDTTKGQKPAPKNNGAGSGGAH